MCTLTIIKRGGQTIITMNRDERMDRHPEYPPLPWNNPQILAPIDPDSSGTWCGVRKDGFWACLLNGYQDDDAAVKNAKSRGRIIPEILSADNPAERMQVMDLSNTRSFRLWTGNADAYGEFYWDGKILNHIQKDIQYYHFVTSSSWKQDEVKAYRRKHFEEWVGEGAPDYDNGIPLINLQNEDDMDEWDILMRRDYAETKSITQIILNGADVNMNYWSRDAVHELPFELRFAA